MISLCPKANFKSAVGDLSESTDCSVVQDIHLVEHEWMSIIPNCHPLEYKRLLAIQQSMSHQFRFYYVIHYNETGLAIGVQYFQYLPFKAAYFESAMKRNMILRKLESLAVDNHFGLLICGSLFSVNAPGFYFNAENLSTNAIYTRIHKPMNSIKSDTGRAELIFKDVPENLRTHFLDNQFDPFDDDVSMTMSIPKNWKSFDDYLGALKHKYAQRARKIIRAAADIERRELCVEELHSYTAEINSLFMQVVGKQSIRLGIPNATYFINMKEAKPETFFVCGYFLNNQLIAFASYIVNHLNDELHYIGFDYALNKTHYLYFNILFDGIRKAIDNDIELLEMGRTAREAKAVVGAHPVVFHSFIRFSSPLSKSIYNYLKKRFQNKTEQGLKDRHPYKK